MSFSLPFVKYFVVEYMTSLFLTVNKNVRLDIGIHRFLLSSVFGILCHFILLFVSTLQKQIPNLLHDFVLFVFYINIYYLLIILMNHLTTYPTSLLRSSSQLSTKCSLPQRYTHLCKLIEKKHNNVMFPITVVKYSFPI